MGRGSTASIQEAHIGIDRLDEDVAWLTSGRACAILAVGGVNLAMLDDDAREARLAAFAGLLNALTYPIQILLRITPLNLLPYLDAVRERARREPSPVLAALGHDHAADLRRLASDRLLLEKHFYVVVTDEDTAAGWGRGRDGRGDAGAEPTRRRLAFRCEELARLLRRCDLPARRLDGAAMAHLYRDWWGADGAAERGPADLADCDRPAVRAARRIVPAAPAGVAEAAAPADDDPPRSPRWGLLGRLRGRGAAPTDDARDPDLRQFAAGLRTVADFIAPAAIEVDRDWIRLDSTYATALAITGYPAAVAPGWLRRLTGFDEPLDIALHIRPLDTGRMSARSTASSSSSSRAPSPTSAPGGWATRPARSRSSTSTSCRSAPARRGAPLLGRPLPPPARRDAPTRSRPRRRASTARSRGCWRRSARPASRRTWRCAPARRWARTGCGTSATSRPRPSRRPSRSTRAPSRWIAASSTGWRASTRC